LLVSIFQNCMPLANNSLKSNVLFLGKGKIKGLLVRGTYLAKIILGQFD
jgi:hypothetical protein